MNHLAQKTGIYVPRERRQDNRLNAGSYPVRRHGEYKHLCFYIHYEPKCPGYLNERGPIKDRNTDTTWSAPVAALRRKLKDDQEEVIMRACQVIDDWKKTDEGRQELTKFMVNTLRERNLHYGLIATSEWKRRATVQMVKDLIDEHTPHIPDPDDATEDAAFKRGWIHLMHQTGHDDWSLGLPGMTEEKLAQYLAESLPLGH